MTTWSYVEALREEHLERFVMVGVAVPKLARKNRAPDEGDIATAYRELAPPDGELVVDYYPGDDGELTIGTRGLDRQILAFALLLAKRCGQLCVCPFPLDALPGAIVEPGDDLAAIVNRIDPDTLAANPELRELVKPAKNVTKPKAKSKVRPLKPKPKAKTPKAKTPKAKAKPKPKSTRRK